MVQFRCNRPALLVTEDGGRMTGVGKTRYRFEPEIQLFDFYSYFRRAFSVHMGEKLYTGYTQYI